MVAAFAPEFLTQTAAFPAAVVAVSAAFPTAAVALALAALALAEADASASVTVDGIEVWDMIAVSVLCSYVDSDRPMAAGRSRIPLNQYTEPVRDWPRTRF